MIIIHDLVEAEARDVSALDVLRDSSLRIQKEERERAAIENIRAALKDTNGQDIYDLFYEFEHKQTYEARVANALDKLEVQLQHNHADISTWEEIEFDMSYMMDKHVLFDPVLKDQIENAAEEKMRAAGVDVVAVKHRAGRRCRCYKPSVCPSPMIPQSWISPFVVLMSLFVSPITIVSLVASRLR